jgi:hypothetical protein
LLESGSNVSEPLLEEERTGRAFWKGNGHKGARRMRTALYLPLETVDFSEVLLHRAEPLPAFLETTAKPLSKNKVPW